MGDILVFAEHANGKVKKTAFELLSKANQLSAQLGGNVLAVVVGKGLDGLDADLAAYGAKKIIHAEFIRSNKLFF